MSAAWVVWRQRRQGAALHAWVERLAARRGRQIAVVALARRLARLLYAMWRDACDYRAVPPPAVAASATIRVGRATRWRGEHG